MEIMEPSAERTLVFEDEDGIHVLVPLQLEDLIEFEEQPEEVELPFGAPDEPIV